MGRWFAAAVLGIAVGACAAIGQSAAEDPKQVVSQRAQERWNLLMTGQTERAYEYFSPASRQTLSFEAFRRRSGGGRWWRSLEVKSVDCAADACQVTMILEYDLFEIKGLKRSVEETWIKDAGTWWLVASAR
jgi:hypothetical protein